MPRDNGRPRKRVRSSRGRAARGGARRSDDPQPAHAPSQQPGPRAIPGFVWDAERQRYFPAVSRQATAPEQQHEERSRRKITEITAAQRLSQGLPKPQGAPSMLRRRPTRMWPVQRCIDYHDRLALVCMGTRGFPIPCTNAHSVVTALGVIDAQGHRVLVSGRRSGPATAMQLGPHNSIERQVQMPSHGEVTAIHSLDHGKFCYASMGDTASQGGILTVRSWEDPLHLGTAYTFRGSTLFTASRPPKEHPHRVALGTDKGVNVVDFDMSSLDMFFSLPTKSDIMSTAFLGGGCAGLAGGRDGRIRLFDTRVPERQHSKLHGLLGTLNYNHKSSIHGLGAEDVMLVSASMDGEVNVWDLRMGNSSLAPSPRPVTKLSSPSRMPSACRLGFAVEQGKVIAAGCDSQVRIWSLHSGQQLHVIPLPAVQGSCTALALKQPGNGGPPGLFLAQSDSIVIVGDHTRDEPQSGPR